MAPPPKSPEGRQDPLEFDFDLHCDSPGVIGFPLSLFDLYDVLAQL